VDRAIFLALWQWAKRRHPTKSTGWIRKTYFQTRNGQHWKFFGQRTGNNGEPVTGWLRYARDGPIPRHVKINGAANPYDPAWEAYFEARLGVKMSHDLRGRRHLRSLWQEQDGVCPVCNQKSTELTGWHNHHVVWRSKGGTATADNRVLLHPNCHRQVHRQGREVVKPRRIPGVGMA
jgi:RNA-directed DNA polymerase